MKQRHFWLAVLMPLVALLELGAHVYFARRAPAPAVWSVLRAPVARLWRSGDAIVVAPEWAEPLARSALDERQLEVERVAGPDLSGVERALEISILSESAPATRTWPVVRHESIGPFDLRVRKNPAPEPVYFDFVAALAEGHAEAYLVRRGARRACQWSNSAAPVTGGLHGSVALPRQRFECPGDHYAAVSIIDDQQYRPRRCILVSAPESGKLVLVFDTPSGGSRIVGHVASSFFLTRDETGVTGSLFVNVGGRGVGKVEHRGRLGWAPFGFEVGKLTGARVEFGVRAGPDKDGASPSTLCFQAEVR